MNRYELNIINTCIKLLDIDGVDSKNIVKDTLQNLKSNNQFNIDNDPLLHEVLTRSTKKSTEAFINGTNQ